MIFSIFNNKKTVNISDDKINLYETHVAPFNVKRAEYLAVANDCDENTPENIIEKSIEDNIITEVEIYKDKFNILCDAVKSGVIF